jgi:hypothetical protein
MSLLSGNRVQQGAIGAFASLCTLLIICALIGALFYFTAHLAFAILAFSVISGFIAALVNPIRKSVSAAMGVVSGGLMALIVVAFAVSRI